MNKTNKKINKDVGDRTTTSTPENKNTDNKTDKATIELPAELTIAQVESFKLHTLDIIDNHNDFLLDDSAIVRIDTTGLQLIIAIVTHILSLNKSLNWQCNANCIKESIKQLGVNEPILNQYLMS